MSFLEEKTSDQIRIYSKNYKFFPSFFSILRYQTLFYSNWINLQVCNKLKNQSYKQDLRNKKIWYSKKTKRFTLFNGLILITINSVAISSLHFSLKQSHYGPNGKCRLVFLRGYIYSSMICSDKISPNHYVKDRIC